MRPVSLDVKAPVEVLLPSSVLLPVERLRLEDVDQTWPCWVTPLVTPRAARVPSTLAEVEVTLPAAPVVTVGMLGAFAVVKLFWAP